MSGFLDKARDVAQKALDDAKEGGQQYLLERKLNGKAQELGHLVYRRSQGESGLDHAVDRAIAEMKEIAAQLDAPPPP
jgi:hypothetical protein